MSLLLPLFPESITFKHIGFLTATYLYIPKYVCSLESSIHITFSYHYGNESFKSNESTTFSLISKNEVRHKRTN